NKILCRVAAEALCNLGAEAIPALKVAESDAENRVRLAVRWALSRLENPAYAAAATMLGGKPASAAGTGAPKKSATHENCERRSELRHSCQRDAFFQLENNDLWWSAKLTQISQFGATLATQKPLKAGDQITVDLHEVDSRVQRTAVARVIHSRTTSGGWI